MPFFKGIGVRCAQIPATISFFFSDIRIGVMTEHQRHLLFIPCLFMVIISIMQLILNIFFLLLLEADGHKSNVKHFNFFRE